MCFHVAHFFLIGIKVHLSLHQMAFLQDLLCKMHIQQSCSENPPFCHVCSIDRSKENTVWLNSLLLNEDLFSEFANSCFEEFKTLYPDLPRGSVHLAPRAFVFLCIRSILVSSGEHVSFPNGCCNKIDCPMNLFYDLVLKKALMN